MNNDNFLRLSTSALACLLRKFAKHLALLACLMILGRATGRVDQDQSTIFLITVGAALLSAVSDYLRRRDAGTASLQGSSFVEAHKAIRGRVEERAGPRWVNDR